MDIHERIGVACAVGLIGCVIASLIELVTTWLGL